MGQSREHTRPPIAFLFCHVPCDILSLEQGVCFPTATMGLADTPSPSTRRYFLDMRYLEAYMRQDLGICGAKLTAYCCVFGV
jgi:hypothetical protein